MRTVRRNFCIAVALVAALASTTGAQAVDAPMRIVMPFAAGDIGDVLARIIGEGLRAATGQPAIVENRTGAGGRIGVRFVRDAPPDGSVLLVTPIAPMAIYPHTYDRLDYDPDRDFAPVAQVATFDFGLAIAPNVPVTSLADLVTWVKANPTRNSFAIPGEGTLPHFCGMLFGQTAGIDLVPVAYRGNAPALVDLMGGHVPMLVTSTPSLVEGHRSGRIRVLATSAERRASILPDVPTFREAGFAFAGVGWYGVYAPARTPEAVTARVSEIIGATIRAPAVQARLAELGLTPTGTTGPELGRIQRQDSALWGPIIRTSRFKAEP